MNQQPSDPHEAVSGRSRAASRAMSIRTGSISRIVTCRAAMILTAKEVSARERSPVSRVFSFKPALIKPGLWRT